MFPGEEKGIVTSPRHKFELHYHILISNTESLGFFFDTYESWKKFYYWNPWKISYIFDMLHYTYKRNSQKFTLSSFVWNYEWFFIEKYFFSFSMIHIFHTLWHIRCIANFPGNTILISIFYFELGISRKEQRKNKAVYTA